jgi:RNA recognition motif-containing protein
MKKMKVKLPLVALFFSLFLVQSALGQENKHFLVVDDQSPVDDVLIINDIESQFESEYGDIFVSKLNSEVTRSLLENKLTGFMY